ncbi:hypothetical protein ATL41_2339 [Flavimobilis soli]|uniref:DUF2304 domain-containing protein n=1 Tax=Flavimobilis soli TaxID=442709 RepID=A0A2A9EH57_9MICO|nr:DUF2304 domain-containing protein [Flavimobilis soli]PFG37572.1 hypothetical protein ATL41_2339 [Flavimobilis soli]
MWIQLILLAAIVGVALTLNRSTADARHQAIRRILLMLFVAGAAASVLFPQILTRIANLIGVGRGADLLLYALVIAFLSFMATSFRRMNQLQSRITVLARELTLAQARAEDAEARNRAAQDRPATAVDDEEGPAGTVR